MLESILSDYTIRTVLIGSTAMGFVSGAIGSFAYLRSQSLVGDAISHATLPGIAGMFLLTGSRSLWMLLLGAALAGWVGMMLVLELRNQSRIHMDSALGIVLSFFFGIGIVLLTYINTLPNAAKAGLEYYIFGQAALMNQQDMYTILGGSIAILIIALLFWKEFKLLSFDPLFARSINLPTKNIDILLTTCIVLALVIGLQAVGVILMCAMIAVPAAAARQWTHDLGIMVGLSGLFGGLAAIAGVTFSTTLDGMPTGPAIVVAITTIFVISLFFAPRRGLLFRWLRMREHKRVINCTYAPDTVYEY
jgi:manganese/zinc/iron transport system permease protein